MRQKMAFIACALCTLFSITFALQKPERHFGCPPGKNACIYPIDDSNIQCETLFDFQVAIHLSDTQAIHNIRREIDIQLSLPSGNVLTPESLFEKQPEFRNWTLQAFEDQADETPTNFTSHAVIFRNVLFSSRIAKGPIKVTVFAFGITTQVHYFIRPPTRRRAKNVILFVGDGMSLPMMAAARLVSRGMSHGKYLDKLHMEKMPFHALQNPSGVDSIITDSANSASAFNTGQKSSVNALGVYADSGNDDFGHPKQETIAEHIKRRFNMSVGVVTTAEVQDATPGAVWAHVRRRSEKAAITAQALNGCNDCVIATQPEVIMGGGGRYFNPTDSIDGSDMYKNYSNAGYTITHTRAEMKMAAENPSTEKLLTITHRGNMEVWLDRNVFGDNMNISENSPTDNGIAPTDQPNLNEMVSAAIKVLSKNENGFYLMVEGASIDKSAHPLDIPRTISDLIELDNTVGETIEWVKANGDDTLILATADHGHGFDVFGTVDTKLWDDAVVATDENPVSDVTHMCRNVTDDSGALFTRQKEPITKMHVRAANRARRKAIGTYGDAGYPDYIDSDGDGFPDSWEVRTTLAAGMNNYPDHTEDYKVSKSIKQPATFVPDIGYLNNKDDDPNGIFLTGNIGPFGSTGVHTLQDVGLFGYGPGAEKIGGNVDNTEVFHIMASALGFGTNGQLDVRQHLFGDFVRCVRTLDECHCGEVGSIWKCACAYQGLEAFVRPTTPICSVNKGLVTPPNL